MSPTRRTRPLLGLIAVGIAVALAGCSGPSVVNLQDGTAPASTDATPTIAVVPGYAVGEFPPIPLFVLPDLSMFDPSASAFTLHLASQIGTYPGLTVGPAHCDAGGPLTAGAGTAYLYGDGAGNYTGPDGTVQNFGNGAGNSTINGVTIQNFGNGAGNYSDGTVNIQNFGNGAGNYSDGTLNIQNFGNGAGNYSDGTVNIQNFGDGSGNYSDGRVNIQNFGNGKGNYSDDTVNIQNFGDGTGNVNGVPVKVDPLAPVPKLGAFPPLAALAPVASCGTTITLSDALLFDFGQDAVRPDAAAVLDSLAAALNDTHAPAATVMGHTDSIGDAAANQDLSVRRADAVVAALQQRGVTTALTAEGFGDAQPIAPNEVDGQDNPAGRQLNRRVEIFVPAF
jgi:OmpA-OmpF porin, OOP family